MAAVTSPAGSTGGSKFRITSQTQLKTKLTDTYLRSKIQKSGIKWKDKDGKMTAVKPVELKKKFSELLKKRGYISDYSLKKDLLKEKVRETDRNRILKTMAEKYSTEKSTKMTKDQIKGNVRMSNMMSRLVKKAADSIRARKDVDKIKEKFKTDYSRLNIHGQQYSVGISSSKLSTDDPRYQKDKQDVNSQTSVMATGNIKPVTGGSKEISKEAGKEGAAPIGEGVGVKKEEEKKGIGKDGNNKLKKASNEGNAISFLQARVNIEKKKNKEENDGSFGKACLDNNRVVDSEFQGGVLYKGKKVAHINPEKIGNQQDNNNPPGLYKKVA